MRPNTGNKGQVKVEVKEKKIIYFFIFLGETVTLSSMGRLLSVGSLCKNNLICAITFPLF